MSDIFEIIDNYSKIDALYLIRSIICYFCCQYNYTYEQVLDELKKN